MEEPSVVGSSRSTRTRPTRAALTQVALADVWPQVSRALLRYLRGRGAGAALAEDVVQDVALRVLTHDVAFESAEDLLRWCLPVARNRFVDHHRASVRVVDDGGGQGAYEHRDDRADVHATVEARIRLHRVLGAIRQLGPVDQQSLLPLLADLSEQPLAADRKEATRLAVRRHRARARLLELVGPAAAVLGWTLGRPRPRQGRPAPAALTLPALLAALVPFVAVDASPTAPWSAPSADSVAVRSADRPGNAPGRAPLPRESVRAAPAPGASATSAALVQTDKLGVTLPAGVAVGTYTRPRRDDRLACVRGLVVVEEICVREPTPPQTPAASTVSSTPKVGLVSPEVASLP